ncbi:glycosyltransferase family 4 protein [Dehalobacterium formicoaceticum]|uniref:Glycosyltransferase family 4 protein n=1 Tax=Dehalobacterium formicoaceticum TaxID=51515 RepID=A0ABT1Y5N2_9FIRM|nr:glycosyltransferase family 4 protein [Dehalobacterium formicoaceticum]MCR6546199.1 glycosyltransferase family 4 protein [Dehalobacterium formicoaceticum]
MAKILILANNDVGLYKFRKELIESFLGEGHEVYISLPDGNYVEKLCHMGCVFSETLIDRRGTNPITDLKLIIYYKTLIKNIKPDIVLTYTIKPNVYGGIACKATNTPYLANVTGLGTSIENGGVLQKTTLALYATGLKKASCVFFQNETNRHFFLDKHIVTGKTKLIPGSGVNLKYHRFEDYPDSDDIIKFLFIGRIMRNKGIDELLEAAQRIKNMYPNVRFDLVGDCEENYAERLLDLENRGIITYYGQQDDVHSFLKGAHAIVLPSYHEGMANVLLEAASSGRPVIASNIPGCRETFDEGVTGYGFEVRNTEALVNTIEKFIRLPYDEKKQMGISGRAKIEREFDRQMVIDSYMEEINRILYMYKRKAGAES